MTRGTGTQGFASMDKARQREIASKGGKAAHARKVAHEWTPEEAAAAGRKGGLRRKQAQPAAQPEEAPETLPPSEPPEAADAE